MLKEYFNVYKLNHKMYKGMSTYEKFLHFQYCPLHIFDVHTVHRNLISYIMSDHASAHCAV